MIVALDHIAIAVPDLEKSIKRFMEDFGLSFEGKEDVLVAKTSTAFFPLQETSIAQNHCCNHFRTWEGLKPRNERREGKVRESEREKEGKGK